MIYENYTYSLPIFHFCRFFLYCLKLTFKNLIFFNRCQDVFLENVSLDKNIAKNKALKENVFMMVVSIELRIPLFLVGKPGSSKSLAKTIVADIMQGTSSVSQMFRNFKQVFIISFYLSLRLYICSIKQSVV